MKTHSGVVFVPWKDGAWQIEMREVHNNVIWQMTVLFVVWPHWVISIHNFNYFAHCAVIQANCWEIVDSSDSNLRTHADVSLLEE